MMRVWSHRPQLLDLTLFFVAYVVACGFAQSLAIVPGTGISIWPPGGLFIATLVLAGKPSWPWWLLAGCLAELFANVLWFHSPLPAAFLIYVGNALEAVVGAWLVNRTLKRPVRLETLQEVLTFVVLAAGVAPIASATVGSATLAWFGMQGQTFAAAWPLWWIGDATGILIVAPLAIVVFQSWRAEVRLSVAQWTEASVLGLIFLGVAALSLSGYLPFAYIIMPPLLWAAVRFEFKGAAVALILLALITAVFTISGVSQFAGDPESQRHKQIMLHLFLAISAFSALIVAAISRQHQQAVATLRRSEQQLQQMIDAVPALIWCATPEGIPCYLNKRVTDVTGVSLKDMIAPDGSRSLSVIHEDDREATDQALARSFETGAPFVGRYRQRRANGPYRWVESRAEPLRDASGAIVQWYGVSVDIEDMMMAQETLHDRERELSQLVDMVPSFLWRLSAAGEPVFFSRRMVEFIGLDVGDYDKPGMSGLAAAIAALVHPDDRLRMEEALNRSIATGESFSLNYRLRRADGVYRWVSGRAEPMRDEKGQIVQWYGLSHDIDDQVRAEDALRNSKRQLEDMIDAVPINILSFSPSRQMTYASKRYLEQVGSPMEHIDHFDALARDLAHPDDFPVMFRRASDGFETGQAFVNRFRRRCKDGAYRWIEARAQPLHDASGAIVQWYIASIDIEDEMRALEALRDRERALRQLVETLPAMLDCAAPDGEPIYRSQQLREFLGYELEELDGSGKSRLAGTLDAGVHPDEVAGVKENYAHCLSTGAPYARRHRLRRFDGEYRWVETRAAPMRNAEGAIVQWNVICLDIDGEVRAQEELRLAQERMARASQAASLAELSASIAHEVNQPLAAIVATSHACRRWLSADPPNLERAKITLERIARDANSASDVVSRIRALFSQMGRSRSPASMAEVITEVCRLMGDELTARHIQIETEFGQNMPRALIDRIQMQQVLVNLIRNAIDALDSVADGARLIRLRAVLDDGDAIRVEVRDLGAGLKEPQRAFEPFFTTKQNGMGMGLAICRSIIESHNGRLWADSNEPRGTMFAFTLPVQAREAA